MITYLYIKRTIQILASILVLCIPIWIWGIAPNLTAIPQNFHYEADIISHDNFYNEQKRDFTGDVRSKTTFFYDVSTQKDRIYIIKNVFDVRTPDDQPIFAVERLYGIDPKTSMHVAEAGDRNRTGYLFAPKNLHKQDYVYWHINYDAPALMKFQSDETILGLPVYRYEAQYPVDQTTNLDHLPGVPESRGVNLDIRLQTWIEPKTGHMIKYQDDTIAYYYDKKTGTRLFPWNKFGNTFTDASITQHAKSAQTEKQKQCIIEWIIPLFFGLAALGALFLTRPFSTLSRS